MMRVGTLMAGRASRMSICMFIRKRSTASPGLALIWVKVAHHRATSGLSTWVGQYRSMEMTLPHVSLATWSRFAYDSSRTPHG